MTTPWSMSMSWPMLWFTPPSGEHSKSTSFHVLPLSSSTNRHGEGATVATYTAANKPPSPSYHLLKTQVGLGSQPMGTYL